VAVPVVSLTDSQRSAARVAALAYPIAMFAVAFANFGLRGGLIVDGDIPETVRRIAAAESVYRFSVALDLVHAAGMVVLLTALFVVLSPIRQSVALLATFLKFVYAATTVLIALSSLSLLRLATTPSYRDGLGPAPWHALFDLTAAGAWEQYYVGLVFWALASTLYGWLWLKSRYIPTALAMFGLVSSTWCVFCAIAFLLDPGFSRLVNVWLFDTPMALSYLALSGWLLFRGLRHSAPLVTAQDR
jgi:hypothetical protein